MDLATVFIEVEAELEASTKPCIESVGVWRIRYL